VKKAAAANNDDNRGNGANRDEGGFPLEVPAAMAAMTAMMLKAQLCGPHIQRYPGATLVRVYSSTIEGLLKTQLPPLLASSDTPWSCSVGVGLLFTSSLLRSGNCDSSFSINLVAVTFQDG
jgi:hypothetical protein